MIITRKEILALTPTREFELIKRHVTARRGNANKLLFDANTCSVSGTVGRLELYVSTRENYFGGGGSKTFLSWASFHHLVCLEARLSGAVLKLNKDGVLGGEPLLVSFTQPSQLSRVNGRSSQDKLWCCGRSSVDNKRTDTVASSCKNKTTQQKNKRPHC